MRPAAGRGDARLPSPRWQRQSIKAYTRSVLDALGVPMDGTPAFCYDTVDYAAAMKQRPLGKFKP